MDTRTVRYATLSRPQSLTAQRHGVAIGRSAERSGPPEAMLRHESPRRGFLRGLRVMLCRWLYRVEAVGSGRLR